MNNDQLHDVVGGLDWLPYACEPSQNVERRDIVTTGDFARYDRALDAWNAWCGRSGGGGTASWWDSISFSIF